jgi:multidrug efflux pump subunit AcrB
MGITAFMVERKVVVYFLTVLLMVGGVATFFQLGRLEDPDFTVKTAVVVTEYPGADPEQVELEVTDRIEKAIQELPELDTIISWSRPGLSIIRVEIKQEFWADRLPQVWDDMRKKIRDIVPQLPPGAGKPDVSDDFNFVYGFVLAITGDGFGYAEIENYAKEIRKELSLVPGVARAALWGVQPKVIYLDIDQTQLSELGLTAESIAETLQLQNAVVDAGNIDVPPLRLRVTATGEFASPEEIGDLVIRPGVLEMLQSQMAQGTSGDGEISSQARALNDLSQTIRIRDIATVRFGYVDPPQTLMRHDGRPALAIQVANVAGGNVPETGRRLDEQVREILSRLPIGVELHKVAWQSDLVSESVNTFVISLIEAILIVLVVLAVPCGLRMGLIIGVMLVLIILGTFIYMGVTATPLHRMSLGALIIALGMMVDNSTFVADAMSIQIQKGKDRKQAAIDCASSRAWPLLGATVIAVMGFYAIFASTADTGEYCRALFTVVAAALLLSWFISMSFTPVMCIDMLPKPRPGEAAKDPYDNPMSRGLRRLITVALRFRWLTILGSSGLLIVAVAFAGQVRQMFFPDSTRNQLMIDYWAPAGTRIQDVSNGMIPIEDWLQADERVESVATFVGAGPPRFYLPIDPELPNPNYGQIIVTAPTYKEIYAIASDIEPWLKENVHAFTRVRKYGVGVSETWKLEARISGPAKADLATLRRLGEAGKDILRDTPLAREVRTEMRNPVLKLVAKYNQQRGRWAGVNRKNIAEATKRAYDGLTVGLYREGEDLYPIILRHAGRDRAEAAENLDALQVKPAISTGTIPLAQVTDGMSVEWEDPVIHRWQRRRAETVQCTPIDGVTFPALYSDVLEDFEALDLPPGYRIFWDGEKDSSERALVSLGPGLLPAAVIIATIIMLLYNSIRVLLCIMLVIPFAAIGIIPGLIIADSPMGFVAILGILSLMGMMIKNMIVITDAIQGAIKGGAHPYDACVESVVTQSKPILLAAGTTVMGVIPLLADVFWNSMAVCIMGGLGFGAGCCIILYPTLYATVHRIKPPAGPS